VASSASDLPKYNELMLPVLKAVQRLGGSAGGAEITEAVAAGFTDEQLSLQYPNRARSVLLDRIDWARSYCKLSGTLDSPRRKLFLLTDLGREIVGLDDAQARTRLAALDRQVRARRKTRTVTSVPNDGVAADEEPVEDDAEESTRWTEVLLARLHRMTPTAFEEFCMYVLRLYGLRLTRVGGTGDEGIDGIGTAPLSPVLSATVAVQVKRYDPATAVGREPVALFQRDASTAGAERAVLITLGRFSPAARKAASTATPTVDLIDGARLCELVQEQGIGLTTEPVVNESWFDRFESP
jgi:restriction system protein